MPLVVLRSFTSQLTSSGESSLYILECGKGKHLECEVIESAVVINEGNERREERDEDGGLSAVRAEEYLFSSPSLNSCTDAPFSICCKNSAYLLPKTVTEYPDFPFKSVQSVEDRVCKLLSAELPVIPKKYQEFFYFCQSAFKNSLQIFEVAQILISFKSKGSF